MFRPFSYAVATAALLTNSVMAQAGPNTLYQYDPDQQTSSFNGTYNVIAMDTALVASLVAPKTLVPIANDTALYPNGWPAGKHPVMVTGGYAGSIKQLGLTIPNFLMNGRIEVPCVDQLGDGTTCFRSALINYVGATNNGQFDPDTVPGLVATLEGTTTLPGSFTPDGAALAEAGNGQYSFEVDTLILNNPLSGPSLSPEAFQFILSKVSSSSLLTAEGFHFFISQPVIANNGLECLNSESFFNESFAQPFFCESQVTFFDYLLEANGVPSSLAGDYNATCYSANAEQVIYAMESCETAEASLDPTAEN